jgi:hypothetical protein
MNLQCVPDAFVIGRKRKATGYEYNRSRKERAKAELQEQYGENAALRDEVEQHKRRETELIEELKAIKILLDNKMQKVDELTGLLKDNRVELEKQKQKCNELTEELNNRNSQVMNGSRGRRIFLERKF